MTPQQITDQKAFHRAELERLDALEKAQRPALAAGQVWVSPEFGVSVVCAWWGATGRIYNVSSAHLIDSIGLDHSFEYVGLARDVLRVVPPDAVEQVAPVQDEPTGAELVGKLCWVRDDEDARWYGPFEIERVVEDSLCRYRRGVVGWRLAKLCREGVTP